MSKREPNEWPYYGPVGDVDSTDPFEWAQARAPQGWHVEGQILGSQWSATSLHGDRLHSSSPQGIVDAMLAAGPVA